MIQLQGLIAINYYTSTWWDMINDPNVQDPTSHVGKKFRLRFRVPFPVFRQLLDMTQALGFELRPKSSAGVYGIPLEIQVLSALRVLGQSSSCINNNYHCY